MHFYSSICGGFCGKQEGRKNRRTMSAEPRLLSVLSPTTRAFPTNRDWDRLRDGPETWQKLDMWHHFEIDYRNSSWNSHLLAGKKNKSLDIFCFITTAFKIAPGYNILWILFNSTIRDTAKTNKDAASKKPQRVLFNWRVECIYSAPLLYF